MSIFEQEHPRPDAEVRYGPHPDQVADVRWPRPVHEQDAAPLVVVVHGGFWRQAWDRTHTGQQGAALADEGWAVAAIEYRRAGGDGGWPATLDDVRLAVDTVPGLVVRAAAAEGLQVDAGRTVLVGHSAGGHLAVWAVSGGARPAGVVGVVSLGGVLDLRLAAALRLGDDGTETATTALLGGGPDDVPDRYAAADPAALAPPSVPVTVVQGALDDTVPPSVGDAYCRRTGSRAVLLPGVDHDELVDPASPAWPAVVAEVRRALAQGRS